MWEMVREQHVISKAAIELAQAKSQYLRTTADAARVKIAQRVAALEREDREEQRNHAIAILNCPNMGQDLHEKAKKTMDILLNAGRFGVELEQLLQVLERRLPAIGVLACHNLSADAAENPVVSLTANLADDDLPPISPEVW
jgi:hypothetical protein